MTPLRKTLSDVASSITSAAGHPYAVVVVTTIVVAVWLSFNWAAVDALINITTILMVFLIQNSQNRDGAAIQAKLDELIKTSNAHNTFMGIEAKTDDEINKLREENKK